MKYRFLFLVVFMLPILAKADFTAYRISESSYTWRYFEMKQLSFDVEVLGLFYQTTATYEIGLIPDPYDGTRPQSGDYEIIWEFQLTEDAVVNECWIKPADSNEFIQAEIVDITTAEELYQKYPRQQHRLLLRHRYQRQWDGSVTKRYQMRFSPVTLTKTPVIKIQFLTPCQPSYNSRRFFLPVNDFYTYRKTNANLTVYDVDNPNARPAVIYGYSLSASWAAVNGKWRTVLDFKYSNSPFIVSLAPESQDRSYLSTYTTDSAQFYQLSLLPPMTAEEIQKKSIVLAADLSADAPSRSSTINNFEKSVLLSTTAYDSITLVYSGFTPLVYDSLFYPVNENSIKNIFTTLRNQPEPKLSTLPHLLKQAVRIFNAQQRGGEIWLISDASTHADPTTTAMEIMNQTLDLAEYPIVFRIINVAGHTWPYKWINGNYYYGNDYLYENLARLTWGTFIKLREFAQYDHLDAMLDCTAPGASAVEIDPRPQSGLGYSRFDLNKGRTDFPITRPYYQIGLFDGAAPFTTSFYGIVDGELYAKDVVIDRKEGTPTWPQLATFWFARYVGNLLLEPQSYETISYIESVSVEHRLLTPYSGFIVPGPGGVLAFQRLMESDETETAVEDPLVDKKSVPEAYDLVAYPNPFNSSTTIRLVLSPGKGAREIDLKISNTLGQIIRDEDIKVSDSEERIEYFWDGLDSWGRNVSSGVYFVSIHAGDLAQNIKISLIR